MPKRNVLWMLAVIAVAVGTAWVMKRTPQARRQLIVQPDAMVEAYNQIIENHYPPVDPLELKRSAVAGMAKALDPQSVYIPYEKAQAFRKRMEGQARGTGLVLGLSDRGPVIDCVHANSPAEHAGLAPGDIIAIIGDQPAFNMSLEQAAARLVGSEDGKVRLQVISPDQPDRPRDVSFEPAEYPVQTVTGLYRQSADRWEYTVDRRQGMVYIRISEFVAGTVERFQKAFREPSSVRGLVLDLRGNPGGYLPEAVALANLFLHKGPIVTVLGAGNRVEEHKAHADGTYPGIDVVILIDGDTASAAEIVAGSLSYADRAILLGSPSRGKHSVQTPLVLDGKLGLLHLTTARFYFASGSPQATTKPAPDTLPSSAGKPITPHVYMPSDPDRIRKLRIVRRRAARRALRPTTLPATRPAGWVEPNLARELIENDEQLAAAIELLKDPSKIEQILKAASQARKKLPETRPAGEIYEINP